MIFLEVLGESITKVLVFKRYLEERVEFNQSDKEGYFRLVCNDGVNITR